MFNYIKNLISKNLEPNEILGLIESNELEKLKEASTDSLKKFAKVHSDIYFYLINNNKNEMIKFLQEYYFDFNLVDDNGLSLLHYAVRKNNIEVVKILLKMFVNINAKDKDSWTPLHRAVTNNHDEIVKELIKAGADINTKDKNSWTPLHWASRNNHIEFVKVLIKAKANLNEKATYYDDKEGFSGITPLFDSIFKNNWEVAKLLIEAGADVNIARETNLKYTPLLLISAKTETSIDIFNMLIKAGADINAIDKYLFTPLHWASHYNHIELVKVLIKAKANLNEKATYYDDEEGFSGFTPLYDSIFKNNWEIAKLLIEAGADVNIKRETDLKYTPLLLISAITEPSIDIFNMLIKAGADINAKDKKSWTPLHWASGNNHIELVKVLIKAKANLNEKATYSNDEEGFFGITPLYASITLNNWEIAKLLIEAGADVNLGIETDLKYTPLLLITSQKEPSLDIFNMLIKAGADINAKDKNSWTPLHWASRKNHIELVKVLIKAGADINEKATYYDDEEGFSGITPLYASITLNNWEIAKLLIEAGADVNLGIETDLKYTPLLLITSQKEPSLDIFNMLIKAGADINAIDKDSWTPLHYAVKNNHIEIVNLLIEAGADVNIASDTGDKLTPLLLLSSQTEPNMEILKMLIIAGASVDYSSKIVLELKDQIIDSMKKNKSSKTDLILFKKLVKNNLLTGQMVDSCNTGDLKIVKELIKAGADINEKDKNSWTPLHWASSNNHIELVKVLIKAKANLNEKATYSNDKEGFSGITPLYASITQNHWEIAKLLIEAGSDVNLAKETGNRYTPLLLITSQKEPSLDIFNMLIKAGADINAKDKYSCTPLHWASSKNHIELVKVLIKAGADINAKDKYSCTPLHWASSKNHIELVKVLIKASADINAKGTHKDKEGFSSITPLYVCIDNKNWEVAKLLIEAGADVNIARETDSKYTPLLLISSKEEASIEIFNMLIKAGADINAKDKENKNVIDILISKSNSTCLSYLFENYIDEKIDKNFIKEISHIQIKNETLKFIKSEINRFSIRLFYHTNESNFSNIESFISKIIKIENFRITFEKSDVVIEFLKNNLFSKLIKKFKVQDKYLSIFDIKEINHCNYLFLNKIDGLSFEQFKSYKNDIQEYAGMHIDLEEYNELHDLYDSDFSKNDLIILKNSVITVITKLLNISGEYVRENSENGYKKYYFKGCVKNEWESKLKEICSLLNQQLSIEIHKDFLVLIEKIEEIIPKLLELKDSNKNIPKLEFIKELDNVKQYYYTFLPEIDLKEWKLKAKKINFRVLFNQPNKVYELDMYNQSSKFYDENFSKKQYIILNEYESIPTKEELNDKKLSDSMLSDNKIFMGYGKGKILYYIDLNLMTHLAVVGSTGSGKSNLMNGIITSLLFNLNLIDALYLIDLKGTEFMKYQDIDSSKINLFTKKSTPKVILEALLELEAEIHLRIEYCQNERQVKLKTNPIFLIIDEFKQIDNIYCETSQDHKDKDEIYKSLNRIGSLSRSSNIKMIIQTQGAKDIPEDIRKHCMSRILMKTSLENDSSIHLQNVDKMQELGINHLTFDKGRYILEDDNDGDTKTLELQFPFVDPYDNLHLSFQKFYDNEESDQFKVKIDKFIDIVKSEYKQLSKTKRLSLQIIENQEIKKQEINITSEFKKVSYDLDSLFNEEEKSFKEVENIQQKIKSFKDNLASKYGENK
ncbi:ankyrin repeat domain-containing protein [Aliarcobacter cryaerophilus]|uniref:ankyrin repeat domain-containing protein n=1 Tax=Aliarcobacter cryaerophilus TaxID=28198 RepID=UPI0021B4FC76|nr:ankyrin repeat domain-containing protein [Aliarcobacter cryaerophilus]MCT7546124.1 ankyrin repeat domain-containing protein [Aliarcobacter cryaerophilus]